MTLASNAVMIKCYKDSDYDWLQYFFLSPTGLAELLSITTGTAVLKFNKTDLKTLAVPVPPLTEQRRIVTRIESLFAKLDEAKEKAQAVVDGFETRRAAILHRAFTGELTAYHTESSEAQTICGWEKISFGKLVSDARLGLVRGKAEQSYDREYGYFKMNNITTDGGIDLGDLICINATQNEIELFSLQSGDLLFNTRNSYELVGKNCVWAKDMERTILFNNNIMRVRFIHGVVPQYISYFLNSPQGKLALDQRKKNTTNVAAIYAKDLYTIEIPLPPLNEQQKIVRILDSLLTKEQRAREAAEGVLERIEFIKKAILARAFRGELGTNDPGEESAVEMLQNIL